MGMRGEIFSTRVALPNRTYFFNVKENRMGDLYLNIVESKNKETGGFDRQSVVLFADDLQQFLTGFDESLKVLEKSVREKRKALRSGPASGSSSKDAYKDRPRAVSKGRPRDFSKGERFSGDSREGPPKNRKVVVRKNRKSRQD